MFHDINSPRLAPRATLTAPSRRGVQRTGRATRRALLALAGVAVSLSVGAGMAPAHAGEAQWLLYDTNANGCYEAATLDRDFNGYPEDQWFDFDNDCAWDTHTYNTSGGDWFAEEMSFDMDENGLPENVLQDTDQRDGFDYVWSDLDQDGAYESLSPLPAAQANAVETQTTVLPQTILDQQNINLMAPMPGFVSTLGELPSITPAAVRF